ncbi:MAG TPA: cytochrome c [Burkholderiales bacterium]|jgi:mono/diheme cytochrome c family protein|nr:cytochrome c [Burkholderiales bacterium]
MKTRVTKIGFVIFAAGFAVMTAHADPFPGAAPAAGKKLFDQSKCAACHISLVGGDGSKVFTWSGHKVRSAAQLLSRVQFCVTNTGAQVFPDEVKDIAAYLNQQYYHFK